ncbi:N-terminal domain of NEFA-interacting nuclear protein NIP30-domain-containing protein [Pestalotiopsis sp. NC0098]|nr:N-terminal domain of NEFA-interacting nuclear protein NIP30-domain-containing protein [Pestalotiopsis sp. NC0098]
MSSRFVSGGTIAGDNSATAAPPTTAAAAPSTTTTTGAAPSAWEKAQEQLEADRRAREAARKTAIESSSGQSLYDVLQANKAAKQAAFEEANKLRNQFRALDDDEVDFLDNMVEEERKTAEEQKRIEEEGLKVFRDAQKKSKPVAEDDDDAPVAEEVIDEWSAPAARKRKREKEPIIKGIKRRVSQNTQESESSSNAKEAISTSSTKAPASEPPKLVEKTTSPPEPKPVQPAATAKSKMGLVDYGSDEDDDDD